MITKCISFLMLALLLFPATEAYGENNSHNSKIGFELRGIRTDRIPTVGWLVGARWSRFLGKSPLHIQLAGHYGTPNGLNPTLDTMYYGTFGVGLEGKFGRTILWEAIMAAGYGQGRFNIQAPNVEEESFFVVEPSFAMGASLGVGWKAQVAASYVHMNNAPNFSGITLGVRIEYKTSTSVRTVDD